MRKNVCSRVLLLAVFLILLAITSVFPHNNTYADTSKEWKLDEVEQAETIFVSVTNYSDTVNGNTSSISSLIGDPGPDGTISFREAFIAANQTSGPKVIQFAPELAGATITFAA